MSAIKLIALDLDGTIFGDDLVISTRSKAAIAGAQQRGILVTIATGRIFRIASEFADELGISAPLICYQGALIRHNRTGETLLHETVPLAQAELLISAARQRELQINAYVDENIFVERMTEQARFYSSINKDIEVAVVPDLVEFVHTHWEPTKMVIVTPAEQTDAVLSEFTHLFGDNLQVTKSHPRFTEFTNIDCSKGRALAALAQQLNLTREQVMAIGDGHNDRDMIEWAGLGVAMSTAPESVRSVADLVCPPLLEDGAACAIEEVLALPHD